MITHQACPVCGHPSQNRIGTFEMSMAEKPGDTRQATINSVLSFVLQKKCLSVSTMRCSKCRHIYTSPTFDERELDVLYSPERTRETKRQFRLSEDVSGKSWREQNNIIQDTIYTDADSVRAKELHKLIGDQCDQKIEKICDFGGRTGSLTERFLASKRYVYDKDLSNLNSESITALSKLDDFYAHAPYDLIILSHVLEHVPFPTELLKLLRSALSEGGLIYVEVPLEYCGAVIKRKGIPLVPHVNYFTRASLRLALNLSGYGTICLLQRQISQYGELQLPVYKALARNGPRYGKQPLILPPQIELIFDSILIWRARHKRFLR